jgi:hypothetical protein
MTAMGVTGRRLFVERLLVEPGEPMPEPDACYDEGRELTVLLDGTPLVEASAVAGTETFTKNDGERGDADFAAVALAGTQTHTAVRGEREDEDQPSARWGITELDTRRQPADVDRD